MKRTILLDGDLYIFKTCAADERPVKFSDDLTVLTGNTESCVRSFDRQVENFMISCKADEVVLCFSSPDRHYFRHDILPTYKQNRNGTRKPLTLKSTTEAIKAKYRTFDRPGLEGDDVMGILSTNNSIIKGTKIIVSGDKDMQSIPGLLFREGKEIEIDEATADYFHMFQTLIGDSTDGYTGCPKVGPVTAAEILGTERTYSALWPKVVQAFEKKGFSEEFALTQARVARILRTKDYDYTLKQPILWRPPEHGRIQTDDRKSDTAGTVASVNTTGGDSTASNDANRSA